MIDLVCALGVEALSDEVKTPDAMYHLYVNREKILANQEFKKRQQDSPLSSERVRELFFQVTGSEEEADRAQAHFILAKTKKERSNAQG